MKRHRGGGRPGQAVSHGHETCQAYQGELHGLLQRQPERHHGLPEGDGSPNKNEGSC